MALRILLADDSMTAQNMGKKILTDAGYEVVTVSNGAAAVKKIAEVTPDLAILDVYMPGYNGLEVCERVKLSSATARIPVLLSVGKMEPFRPEDGMKVKADGVIIKPFEATDLVTVVGKLSARGGASPASPATAMAAAASAGTTFVAPPPPPPPPTPTFMPEPSVSAPARVEQVAEPAPAPEPQHFGLLPAPAHAEVAPVLQTFEPADEPVDIAGEPHLESHTAAPALADANIAPPPEFQATAIQDSVADNTRHVMTEAALMEGYSFATPPVEEEPAISDVLSDEDREFLSITARPDAIPADPGPTDVPPASSREESEVAPAQPQTWHAEEEELTPDDLALDLEEALRVSDATPDAENESPVVGEGAPISQGTGEVAQSAQSAGGTAAAVEDFDEFVDLTTVEADKPERSAATPMLAPIGKTSFDEFDAIMEQASARFDSVAVAPAPAPGKAPDAATDVLLSDLAEDRTEEPALEADLVLEETPATAEESAEHMHASESLNGVFDLDAPADTQPAAIANDEPSTAVVADAQAMQPEVMESQHETVSTSAPVHEPILEDSVLVETETVHSGANDAADQQPDVTLPTATTEPMPAEIEEPALVEHATDLAVAAVNAEIQSVPDAAPQGPVERVVERVVDRLRPMLSVMVEEIMKELKKN